MTTHKPVTQTTGTTIIPAAPKATAEDFADLRAQMAARMASHVAFKDGMTLEQIATSPVNYVTAKNGVFRVSATPVAFFATLLYKSEAKKIVPGLQDLKPGPTLRIPKIPFEHWVQVLSYYRDVYAKDKTEASVLFFWNDRNVDIPPTYTDGKPIDGVLQVGQLILYCPKQKNSAGLSNFTGDTMVPWLRKETTPLLETHSHHTMGAFWSGTDDANENMNQFYGVYGTITAAKPAFLFRYVHGDDKTNIDMSELFEKPSVKTVSHVTIGDKVLEIESQGDYDGPWPALQYPEDWMTQHSVSYAVSPSYPYGKGGGQANLNQGGGTRYGGAGSVDDHWWNSDYDYGDPRYDYRNGNRPQTHLTPVDGQKKTHGSALSTTKDLVLTTIETETASVDILTRIALSSYAQGQIEGLINAICKAGYDQFFYEADLRIGTII
jgi:hypothetical protein